MNYEVDPSLRFVGGFAIPVLPVEWQIPGFVVKLKDVDGYLGCVGDFAISVLPIGWQIQMETLASSVTLRSLFCLLDGKSRDAYYKKKRSTEVVNSKPSLRR